MPMLHGHRHSPVGQHEHEFEPQYGLPEALPADEHVLWQGGPAWKTLAVRRFHVRKLVIYFVLLLVLRVVLLMSDGAGLAAALRGSLPLLVLAALAVAVVATMAWLTARTTVYTITDKRVVMRIGIVLTLALNLPLRRLEAAGLNAHPDGFGDISLRLLKPDHIAYLHLWPHARAWRVARPEPTLLCVPDAKAVAQRLTDAWQALNADLARTAAPAPAPNQAAAVATEMQPSLAAR